MNTQTGDLFRLSSAIDEETKRLNFAKIIPEKEFEELRQHNNTQERLRRYKQMHADDRCGKCALTLRQHTLKMWQQCEYVLAGGELKST